MTPAEIAGFMITAWAVGIAVGVMVEISKGRMS